jgi:CBS domain-containing membrane protein
MGFAQDLRVAHLMTRGVFTLVATQSLPLAESLMGMHRVRHVPVVDDTGALVGLVTHRDLLRAKISELAPLTADERSSRELVLPVSRVMQTAVWTIGSDALALTAARIMRDHRIGCLPVVDDGRLVGIVTEADLLTLVTASLGGQRPPRPWTVERAMTPSPVTIGPETTMTEARSLMDRYGIRHLPIVLGERPLSMISDRDLRVAEVVFGSTEHAVAARAARLVAADPVRRVPHDAPLDSVLLEMFGDRLDAVLVVDGDRLVGVLAASDACRILGEHLRG